MGWNPSSLCFRVWFSCLVRGSPRVLEPWNLEVGSPREAFLFRTGFSRRPTGCTASLDDGLTTLINVMQLPRRPPRLLGGIGRHDSSRRRSETRASPRHPATHPRRRCTGCEATGPPCSISMGKKIKNAHLQITVFILSLPTPNSLPINFHLASSLLFVGKRIFAFFLMFKRMDESHNTQVSKCMCSSSCNYLSPNHPPTLNDDATFQPPPSAWQSKIQTYPSTWTPQSQAPPHM